jgi:hypothetical protein
MLRSNESLRGMLRECQRLMLLSNECPSGESLRGMLCEGLRRFLLKQNQKEKQNGCNGKSPIDWTLVKYDASHPVYEYVRTYFMKSMLHHTLLNESVQTDVLVTIFSVSVIKYPLTFWRLEKKRTSKQ